MERAEAEKKAHEEKLAKERAANQKKHNDALKL